MVHCLPFLSKIWHSKGKDLSSVTDDDLRSAGISLTTDRSNILLSIQQFLDNESSVVASAPIVRSESASGDDQLPTNRKDETNEFLAECVICMENSVRLIVDTFLTLIANDKKCIHFSVRSYLYPVAICAVARTATVIFNYVRCAVLKSTAESK